MVEAQASVVRPAPARRLPMQARYAAPTDRGDPATTRALPNVPLFAPPRRPRRPPRPPPRPPPPGPPAPGPQTRGDPGRPPRQQLLEPLVVLLRRDDGRLRL